MAVNRSEGRDVHIYDAKDINDPDRKELGGLILTNGVTNANFYSMVEIICFISSFYVLRDEGGTVVQRDDHPLQPDSYYIVTAGKVSYTTTWPAAEYLGSITVNDEAWLVRTISLASGTRVAPFRNAVRERDRRCIITGKSAVKARGSWVGFEAARIFPLAYEGHWKDHNYGRWITIQPDTGRSINSVQNGMLLDNTIHALFDGYDVSINPDVWIPCFRNVIS